MKIACTIAKGHGDTDQMLFTLAHTLLDQGIKVCGTVQINTRLEEEGPCDMDIKVLPDGPLLRISQKLGSGSKGCRLNPDALETAVGLVETSINRDIQCLIINKFGKHEAQGRGFRTLIAETLARNIPVLVGLNRLNQDAFKAFSEDMAVNLPPDAKTLEHWLLNNL